VAVGAVAVRARGGQVAAEVGIRCLGERGHRDGREHGREHDGTKMHVYLLRWGLAHVVVPPAAKPAGFFA
jgi:hypothetical protein